MENKIKIVASLLAPLSLTDEGKKLSNMMHIEEQSKVIAFFRDGSTYQIPVEGDGLDIMYHVIAGLRERRDAEKDGNQLSDSMPTC